ncbi:MAG: DUF1499 domain-containing protein [Pseudomonadota bacterium]
MPQKKRSSLLIKLPIMLIVGYFGLVFGVRVAMPEAEVGLVSGSLRDCPPSPNCVSSLAPEFDQEHRVAPLAPAADLDGLETVLQEQFNAEIVASESNYMHAVFTTRFMFFKDDVELYLPAPGGPVHIRSASRLGYSDLGANRARVEALRAATGS